MSYFSVSTGVVAIALSGILAKWTAIPGEASAFWRMLIAAAVLLPWWLALRPARLPLPATALAMLAGILFGVDIALYHIALQITSVANATLLAHAAPVWVALGALVFFRERLPLLFWLGIAMAAAGVVLVMSAGFANLTLGSGDVLAITASLFYAGYLVTTERARTRLPAVTVFMFSLLGSVAVLLPLCFVLRTPLTGYSGQTWALLVALALVSQLGGWFAISYALGHLRATVISVSLLGQPVLTALLGVPLLGEYLTTRQILGGLLVLAGIYFVSRRAEG
jgi:drug/metabolite transporter (DMT)-like permease